MDYARFDSSGTDDDLPPSHPKRMSRGVRVPGNYRSAVMSSIPYSRAHDETDMDAQIHLLEQEAYSAVLRAFKAQADAITWEKEGLITELRKELRLSNEEHRELLGKVNADDVIRRIREWRQAGGLQSRMLTTGQTIHDTLPSPSVSASRKKQKINQSIPSQSFGGLSSFHPMMPSSNQPSFSASRGGSIMGAREKKLKENILPGASSMQVQYPTSGPTPRGPHVNRSLSGVLANGPGEAASFSPLIGRKVRTRWPDDNHFYEAIITDYNPIEGLHALVYDMKTAHETWEWVNLAEISPDDIQWVAEEPGISQLGGYGGSGIGLNRSGGHDLVPGTARGMIPPKRPSKKEFPPSQNDIGNKGLNDLQLLHTDSLIKEVERVFGGNQPHPIEVERAKKLLKDHEQALLDAISRLANISNGESDQVRHKMHMQQMQ